MLTRTIFVFFTTWLLAGCAGTANLPDGMRRVTVDELYMSTEGGVQKLQKAPVRIVVPSDCGVAEVDQKYKSTERRVVDGREVVTEKFKTMPVRKLFCPPGVLPQYQAGGARTPQQPQPAVNTMSDSVCRGYGGLAGVRELMGCR